MEIIKSWLFLPNLSFQNGLLESLITVVIKGWFLWGLFFCKATYIKKWFFRGNIYALQQPRHEYMNTHFLISRKMGCNCSKTKKLTGVNHYHKKKSTENRYSSDTCRWFFETYKIFGWHPMPQRSFIDISNVYKGPLKFFKGPLKVPQVPSKVP